MSEEGDLVSEDSESDCTPSQQSVVEVSPDRRFERFADELGHSSYKNVFRCYDTESGRQVAWHAVSANKLNNRELEKLRREVEVIEGLQHPNIVSVLGAWYNREKSEFVVITEVVSGGPLTCYLRKIKTPLRRVVRQWCREILQALKYLHSKAVIHLDLKVENVHIDCNTGKARLCNFGLSAVMKANSAEYLAPEAYDEEYGTSVDIYALGMTILEIVTRSTPYSEYSTPAAIYHKSLSGVKPKSFSRIQDAEVKDFISSCLAHVDKRPTAAQLLTHSFLSQQENEKDGWAVLVTQDTEACRVVPIKLKILHGKKIDKVKFDYKKEEKVEDLAQQVVSELGLDRVFIESIASEIRSQVASDERNLRHPNVIIVKPSSYTVLPSSPVSAMLANKSFAELEPATRTTSLIDMYDYIDDKRIPVAFTILGSESPLRIEFEYSITFDRPDSVARELINELNIPTEAHGEVTNFIRKALRADHEKKHKECQTPCLERQLYYKLEEHSTMTETQLQDLSFDKVCSPFTTGTISPIEAKALDINKLQDGDFFNRESISPRFLNSLSAKPKKSAVFSRDIQFGLEGEDVKAVQEALNATLGLSSNQDGKFDMQTWRKLVSFQEDHGLVADGVVRRPTWDKLVGDRRWDGDISLNSPR